MCYNARVSFITFIIGIGLALKIWIRDPDEVENKKYDKWNALFIVSFVSMQLLEGLIWLGYDWVRYLIPYLISLQPIVQSFGNAYFNEQPLFYIPVVLGLAIMGLPRVPNKIGVGAHGHLDWNIGFNSRMAFVLFFVFYYAFMSVPLLWQRPFSRYGGLLIYGILILVWSLYNYLDSGEFSSMWCFLAVGYAVIAYFVNTKHRISPVIVNDNSPLPHSADSN